MNKHKILFLSFFILFSLSACRSSEPDYSAAILIKGRDVKMTMYGGVYYDAIDDWENVRFVLDKVVELHSVKKVLIRVVDTEKDDERYMTNFVLIKIKKYFSENGVSFEVRDERAGI